MSFTKRNYADLESKGGLYFMRDALDCENLGVSVFDVEDGREGVEHDHAEEGEEEVYVLVDGAADLTVEGEVVTMEPGDAVRVAPEATRRADLHGSTRMVVVGAP